jgi:putative tryptophan/tyrosine transport system substrate-binding protein
MKRREVITLIGAIVVGWPLAARAEQSTKVATIGLLDPNSATLEGPRVKALVQRLGELGWVEGRNIAIEYRYAEGRNEHLADVASEFVRLKVDVIVTSATPPTLAAKKSDVVNSDCVRCGRRSDWRRVGSVAFAPRRKHHRSVATAVGHGSEKA